MNRLPDICECSKPNSQKFCRIPCGLPRYDGNISDYVLPDEISDGDDKYVFDTVQADDELEPMLNSDGTPMYLMGYPVMKKKEKKGDEGDG